MDLSSRDRQRLIGVHPDLIRVVELAAQRTPLPFCVLEGVRTAKRQALLVAAGASKTLKSRHLTGHAVDLAALVGGKVRWDWPLYGVLAAAMKAAAETAGVGLEWGGDWRDFKDGPHFQLPRSKYP